MKLLKEFWNFILWVIIGNEECLFEDHPPVDPGVYEIKQMRLIDLQITDKPMCRVKAIPFAETGCVDEHGHEHQLTKVYTCDNCHHLLEIPDVIQRPLGVTVDPCTSDASIMHKPIGHKPFNHLTGDTYERRT